MPIEEAAVWVFSVVAAVAWLITLRWVLQPSKLKRYNVFIFLLATVFWWLGESLALRLGRYQYSRFFPLSFNPWGGTPAQPDDLAILLTRSLSWIPAEIDPMSCRTPQDSWNVPLPVVALEAVLLFWFLRVSVIRLKGEGVRTALAAASISALLMVNLFAVMDPVVSTTQWCGQAHLDPRSSGLDVINLWTWFTDEVHPGYWFGVPLVNYAGWFLTVFTFTFLLRLEDDGSGGILSPANHRFGLLSYGGALLLLFILLLPLKVVVDLFLVHGHEALIVLREDIDVPRAWQFSTMSGMILIGLALALLFGRRQPYPRIQWIAALPQLAVLMFCLVALVIQPKASVAAVWIVSATIAILMMRGSTSAGVRRPESENEASPRV
jgi:hypothetical protein